MIKILDCTLRDGGYKNSWKFGVNNIKKIIEGLSEAELDIVECGFISNIDRYYKDISLFNSADELLKLTTVFSKTHATLMLNFGEDILSLKFNRDIETRLAFKPMHLSKLFDYVNSIKLMGSPISLNSMHIGLYSDNDLERLANIANELNPSCLTAVDTMGIITPDNIKRIFKYFDKNLSKDIPLGLHTHNNMNLAKENILTLINLDLDRDIIIDTSLNGLSRGGGMFPTKDLAEILNNGYGKNYNLSILHNMTELINSLVKLPDNSQAYYLSAKYNCHPNYAE